jgi:hypothetical protein
MIRTCHRCGQMYQPDLDRPKTFSLIYCSACYDVIQAMGKRINKRTRRKFEVISDAERIERLRARP